MASVFISYSRKDRDFVLKLHNALAELKRDTWVDWQDIPLTADFLKEICAGIDASDTFVFVMSPESVSTQPTLREEAS
jgi:TIR domain-containing protein